MSRSLTQPLPPMEVQRVDGGRTPSERTVQQMDRLSDVRLQALKAKVGAAVKVAIGPRAHKEFGDPSLIGKVCSGEKVPDYLARIYQDCEARRRLARALIQGDDKVRVRTVIEFDEEVG